MPARRSTALTPPLKVHGGKGAFNGKLAKWIISLMPPRARKGGSGGYLHYVEPFFGGGAVLLANDPVGISEVVNDLDGELINFWGVLADPDLCEIFLRRVQGMPFAELLWNEAVSAMALGKGTGDVVLRALSFFVCCRQSLAGRMKGFAPLTKTRIRSGMNEQASAWLNVIEGLPAVHERLKRVVILGPKDAKEVIRQQNGPQTLFYCDPPYLHETRSATGVYQHEMSDQDHRDLLELLRQCNAYVMLSGYRSKMYDDLLSDWNRHEFKIVNNAAGGKKKEQKTECLWVNY
jgi:DNA adenine methylase